MHSFFKQKHQKLILQCYPSPKLSIAETKPNQAELSYLVFYASSRRTKLEKVGIFLLKKTASDISHKRVGHLKVTLYILQELIEKCSEDIGFLTPYFLSIMNDVVSLGDLSVCQLANEVFVKYCALIQPTQRQILSLDSNVLKTFIAVLNKFLDFSHNNQKEWLRISLNTSLAIADYIDFSFVHLERINLIKKSLDMILNMLKDTRFDDELIRTQTTSTQLSPNDLDLDKHAIQCLKSFFDTSSKRQLDESTNSVLSYILKENAEIRWSNAIFAICTRKTHIELRHRILILFLQKTDRYVDIHEVEVSKYLLKIVSNLLNNPVLQFIGLPVLDIVNKVIQFEKSMIINNDSETLKSSYSEVLVNLASRIYYNTQLDDILACFLNSYYYEYTNNGSNKLTESQFFHFTEAIIADIKDILIISEKPEVRLKISPFVLSTFNHLYILFPFDAFANIKDTLELLWLKLIDEFYLFDKQYQEEANQKVPGKRQEVYSIPNVEMCILNNIDNNLFLFLEGIEKIISSIPSDEVKKQISITCTTMAQTFKINFLLNYLKFSSNWLADEEDFKYPLSLLLLGVLSTQIEGGSSLAALIDSKIAYSQQKQMWPKYIGYTPTSPASSHGLTNEELYELLSNIDSVSQWIHRISMSQTSSLAKKIPKPFTNHMVMSTSNSFLSLPGNGSLRAALRNGGQTNGSVTSSNENNDITDDNESNELEYSEDMSFLSPNGFNIPGSSSLRSGWSSMRSGHLSRHVNLQELKQSKNNTVSEGELSRLVKTRTNTTLGPLNANTAGGPPDRGLAKVHTLTAGSTHVPPPSAALPKEKSNTSGLAFSITGIDFDEDEDGET